MCLLLYLEVLTVYANLYIQMGASTITITVYLWCGEWSVLYQNLLDYLLMNSHGVHYGTVCHS